MTTAPTLLYCEIYGQSVRHLIGFLNNGAFVAYPGGAYLKRKHRVFAELGQAQAFLDSLK